MFKCFDYLPVFIKFRVDKDSYLVHKRVVLRGDMLKEELGKVFRV